MEIEQTINPGTNQVVMENQRNNASFNQNNLVLTFGSFPSSPITDTVKLPCIFGGKTGSAMDTLMSEKNSCKNSAPNDATITYSVLAENDKKIAVAEDDLVSDQVPIIGSTCTASKSVVGYVQQPLVVAELATAPALPQSAETQGACSQQEEATRRTVDVAAQVVAGDQSGSDTQRFQVDAELVVTGADTHLLGSSTLHNGVVPGVTQVDLNRITNIAFDDEQSYVLNSNVLHFQPEEGLDEDSAVPHTDDMAQNGKVLYDNILNNDPPFFGMRLM
jgi:hypothetical protein